MKLAWWFCVAQALGGCHDQPAPRVVRPVEPTVTVSPPTKPALQVFLGPKQTCVRDASGAFHCAGGNFDNAFPLPEGPDDCPGGGHGCYAHFTTVEGFQGLDALAFGFLHACGSGPRGVSCWGDREQLQGSESCSTPRECRKSTRVTFDLKDVAELASTSNVTCARTRSGDVYCWGWNEVGLVGDGTTDGVPCATITDSSGAPRVVKCRLAPTRVVGVEKATQLVMGMSHACALLAGGTVRCWGENETGQLGDGTPGDACASISRQTTCRATAVAVKDLDHVVQIAAGRLHTCAVREDGTVRCWGFADAGRLGDGTEGRAGHTPVAVSGLTGVVEVAAGFTLTCARTHDGKVSCWGLWPSDGRWEKSLVPVAVSGIRGEPVGLVANESEYCVTVKNGPPWCWGQNDQGQLGVATTKVLAKPTPLAL